MRKGSSRIWQRSNFTRHLHISDGNIKEQLKNYQRHPKDDFGQRIAYRTNISIVFVDNFLLRTTQYALCINAIHHVGPCEIQGWSCLWEQSGCALPQ